MSMLLKQFYLLHKSKYNDTKHVQNMILWVINLLSDREFLYSYKLRSITYSTCVSIYLCVNTQKLISQKVLALIEKKKKSEVIGFIANNC